VQTVTATIACPVDECWRVFTDPTALTSWVPGLRDARVIEANAEGLPIEIQFEFANDLLYSLIYSYDHEARIVHWEPRAGEHGAVRGYAQFEEAEDDSTKLTYALHHDSERKAAERAIDSPKTLVAAFARHIEG
jgi:hypothetical protein